MSSDEDSDGPDVFSSSNEDSDESERSGSSDSPGPGEFSRPYEFVRDFQDMRYGIASLTSPWILQDWGDPQNR